MIRLILISLVILLAACGPKTQVTTVTKTIYPNMPPVSYPPDPQLGPCQWAKPLKVDEWELIYAKSWKGKKCKDYSDNERMDDEFVEICMEHPIDTESNINYGLDVENWNCYRENMAKIHTLIKQYKNRIDRINNERQEWKDNNKK